MGCSQTLNIQVLTLLALSSPVHISNSKLAKQMLNLTLSFSLCHSLYKVISYEL